MIRQGKLLACGPLEALRRRGSSPHLEIAGKNFTAAALEQLRLRPEVAAVARHNGHLSVDLAGETEVAPLITLLVNAGVQIEDVRREQASLEDVFLTLMEEDQ